MKKLKIEYISIDDLTPYENNAKIHTEEQIEQIKKSITDFGMNDPIAVWGKENMIVEGHGRLMACKELGIEQVPIIRLDDLTEEQRKAYTLIHNQTTMNTDFDIEKLNLELDSIVDINMDDFGFELDSQEDFIQDLLDEDFSPEKEDRKEFQVTLRFDIKYQDQVLSYIDEVGTDAIVNKIIENALKGENENA